MSGMRIGGGDKPGLDQFQAQRAQALQRLHRGDLEARLQAAIKNQRGTQASARSQANGPANAGVSAQYARIGALDKPDPKPSLGQVLDILA